MKVALILLGRTHPDAVAFGGVVVLPKGMGVDDVECLFAEYMEEEHHGEFFTEWLVKYHGFGVKQDVGYSILDYRDYRQSVGKEV